MRRHRVVIIVVLFVVAQISMSFVSSRTFRRQMREEIDLTERHMLENGISPKEAWGITDAMKDISFSVSTYVRDQFVFSFLMNVMLIVILLYDRRKEGSPSEVKT